MNSERWDQLSPDEKARRVVTALAITPWLSAAQIASQLGTTRNAVIGVCNRNGIRLPLDHTGKPRAAAG